MTQLSRVVWDSSGGLNMDSEMMAEALAKILEELNQIKQDVRWLREH